MKNTSQEISALRQEGVNLLCEFEDSELLGRVVALIRQSYLEEIVEIGPNGQPLKRSEFLKMMEQANGSIDRGEGLQDDEMQAWIESLPNKD